jgi:hypothetical protein
MLRHVDWEIATDVSNEHSAIFIFIISHRTVGEREALTFIVSVSP